MAPTLLSQALIEDRKRAVDLIRLTHTKGEIYSFNLLSLGFTADVGALTNRYFKPFGHLGYLLGVFVRVVQLRRRAFRLRCDDDKEWDERRCLFLSFNNSKFTGGTMLIAPQADPTDGLIEFVRWGPIGRIGLLRMLPKLYDGTHIEHPLASRRAVRHVEFGVNVPVDVLIDGEIAALECCLARYNSCCRGHLYMKRALLALRSAISMDSERLAFFRVLRRCSSSSAFFSTRASTTGFSAASAAASLYLAGARVEVRSLAGVRSSAHLLLHGESRQSF